jgi:hypothetical protein
MKLALAIICSFVLAGTPFLFAQSPAPNCSNQPVPACCQHGVKMACCSAKPPSDSQPMPAIPAQNAGQTQLSLPPINVAVWVAPANEVDAVFASIEHPPTATKASLYMRNCAWLI